MGKFYDQNSFSYRESFVRNQKRVGSRRRYSAIDHANQERRDSKHSATDSYQSKHNYKDDFHDFDRKEPSQSINLNPKNLNIRLKTDAQIEAWNLFHKSDILVMEGPAGCGKTYVATALAINELYHGRVSNIIFTRPIVDAEEELGFLPGDLKEKTDPYMRPIYDQLDQLVGRDPEFRQEFDKKIEVVPLAFTRGRTYKNAVCVLDEAQNATYNQLKMFLTRFDENSKIILNGDITQIDNVVSGLDDTISDLDGMEGFGIVEFHPDDSVRHPRVAEIVRRMNRNSK